MWVSFCPRLCRGSCLFAAAAPGRADPIDAGENAIEEKAIDLADVRSRVSDLKAEIDRLERQQLPVDLAQPGPIPATRQELEHYIKTLRRQLQRAPYQQAARAGAERR